MKVVVAMDSLKGSLTSMEAGNAVRDGILQAMPKTEVVVKPLADGGEGTVDALIWGLQGEEQRVTVTGPMGKPVNARYGILEGRVAVMEMAEAAGITLVPEAERDPRRAGTRGVGEMIWDALEKGCREFLIGIGGSATNDGGAGMLEALGCRFYTKDHRSIHPAGENLKEIASIDCSGLPAVLQECRFRIACDVKNPLCGPNGASRIFGPQKGADHEMVRELDEALAHLSEVTERLIGRDAAKEPGTGAAGGLGFAFLAYLDASLEPGVDIVLDAISLEEELRTANIAVTGEGRLDAQTVMGKAPAGVARLAKKQGCTVIALAGCAAEDAAACNQNGIDAYFPILQNVCTPEEALEKETARKNMESTARQVFRLVNALHKL